MMIRKESLINKTISNKVSGISGLTGQSVFECGRRTCDGRGGGREGHVSQDLITFLYLFIARAALHIDPDEIRSGRRHGGSDISARFRQSSDAG